MGNKSRQHGGAALEYVLVSTFAAALSLAVMAVVGGMVKDQVGRIGERLGLDADAGALDVVSGIGADG